jgi:hypothetical protein
VAAFEGETFAEGFNDPSVPGEVALSHSLITSRMTALADKTCKAGEPKFEGAGFVPSATSAASELADPAVYKKAGSTTLDGQPRNRTVGAFNAK